MTRAASATALLLLALATPAFAGDQAAQVFENVSPSVYSVLAKSERGMMGGSAVVVRSGYVVTNNHVVAGATGVHVKHGAEEDEAVVEAVDKEHDLALLRVDGLTAPVVNFGVSTTLRVGQTVYAIGSPAGLELSLSEGLVSSMRTVGSANFIQTTAPISPGSSGGGLFDERGRLLGITTMQVQDGQNLNFAIPVESLRFVGINSGATPITRAEVAVPTARTAAPEVMRTTPAATVEPTGPASPTKSPRFYVASVIMALVIVLAIPATKWLVAIMSSDALPDPGPPPLPIRRDTAAQPADRLGPFRDLARREAESGRHDAALWKQAMEQSGFDEVAAVAIYAGLRAPVLHQAEMERRKNAGRPGA